MTTLRDRWQAATRAWRQGPALPSSEIAFGVDASQWSPSEYGEYIATSNAVYTCVNLRAKLLSSLPLLIYKRRSGRPALVEQGTLYDLLANVNDSWTLSRLLYMTEQCQCLWGQSYWTLERNMQPQQKSDSLWRQNSGIGLGKPKWAPTRAAQIAQEPREIWWAQPDRMKVFPDPETYISHFEYTGPDGREIPFQRQEVVWLRFPNPLEEFAGLSPLAAARLSADVSSAALKYNRAAFANGLNPGGIVSPKEGLWTKEQAEQVKTMLEATGKGAENARRWLVMRGGVELSTSVVSPHDAEFLGALKWSLEDVCRAYGVPLDLVGGERTYSNVESAMKALWTNCLIPEAQFIASELTEHLVPMFGSQADYVKFDLSGVEALKEDRGEIVAQMKTLSEIGVPLNPLLAEFMPSLLPPGDEGYEWGNEPNKPAPAPAPAPPAEQAPRARALPLPAKVTITAADIEVAFKRWDELFPKLKGLLSAQPAKPRDYGDDSPWVWEHDTNRYRNTSTGVFISARQMDPLRGEFRDAQRGRMSEHARDYSAGDINAAEWERRCRETLRTTIVDQYVVGRGGRGSMDQSDWGRVGAMTRGQYAYLRNFAGELEGMSEAQINARLALYVDGSDTAYERAHFVEQGVPVDKLPTMPGEDCEGLGNCACHWQIEAGEDGWDCTWTLGDADHCDTCLEHADQWAPLHITRD